MPTVIRNTPSELIPQELFNTEKTQEYWNVLYPDLNNETIGIDKFGAFFLLYPKPKEEKTIHEITLLYQHIKEKFPNQANALGVKVYENNFNVLVMKDQNIVYVGYFNFAVNEDIVYHTANVAQHFFEDNTQITCFYKQLSSQMLKLLNVYFEMKQL